MSVVLPPWFRLSSVVVIQHSSECLHQTKRAELERERRSEIPDTRPGSNYQTAWFLSFHRDISDFECLKFFVVIFLHIWH